MNQLIKFNKQDILFCISICNILKQAKIINWGDLYSPIGDSCIFHGYILKDNAFQIISDIVEDVFSFECFSIIHVIHNNNSKSISIGENMFINIGLSCIKDNCVTNTNTKVPEINNYVYCEIITHESYNLHHEIPRIIFECFKKNGCNFIYEIQSTLNPINIIY